MLVPLSGEKKAVLVEGGMGLLLETHTLACAGATWQLGGGGMLLRCSQLRKPLQVEKPVVPQW